jgi:pimeloyl-ACP methyl ester carboxylesterase
VKSNTLQYQSATIFYRTIGIHGFGEDGDIWKNQVELLKDHFYLIIPDLPGSGKSELIKDMSIDGMAEIIKAIIDREIQNSSPIEGGCVGAVGHSMGGYITLAFAEKYPDLLSSFALVHSSAFADSKEKKATRLKSIEFIKKHGAYEFLRSAIPGLFGEHWSKDHQQEINELIEKSKNFTDDAIIQYYRAMINRPDRTAVLKNFSKPVLFIMGEHDNAVPFQQSLQQCYLPDQSQIHILRNSAHMGMLEEKDKVNTALQQLR